MLCNRPLCSADINCTCKEWLLFSYSNFKSLFLKVYAIHKFFVILFFQVVKDTDTQSVTVYLSIHRNRKMFRNPFFLIQQTAHPYDGHRSSDSGSVKKKLKSESSNTVPLSFMEKFLKFIWQIYVKDADTMTSIGFQRFYDLSYYIFIAECKLLCSAALFVGL